MMEIRSRGKLIAYFSAKLVKTRLSPYAEKKKEEDHRHWCDSASSASKSFIQLAPLRSILTEPTALTAVARTSSKTTTSSTSAQYRAAISNQPQTNERFEPTIKIEKFIRQKSF